MKVKKAAKRLSRVEALLSAVLDGYATDIAEVRGPLEAATAAVKRARSAIDHQSSSTAQAATSGHTAPGQRRLTAQGAKKASPPQKKQIASAKRKAIQPASQPKKRISAEGLKRIADANRRRANRRAAPNTPARKIAVQEVAAESPTTRPTSVSTSA